MSLRFFQILLALFFALSVLGQDFCKIPVHEKVSGNRLYTFSDDGNVSGINFSTDGLKLFLIGHNEETVVQYNLSIPFDISTAVKSEVSYFIGNEQRHPQDIAFSPDGLNMYATGNVGIDSGSVDHYRLDESFDLTTMSYSGTKFDLSEVEWQPLGVDVSGDGSKLFVTGLATFLVHQFNLSTPFELITAENESTTLTVTEEVDKPTGLTFSQDGLYLYVTGIFGKVARYDLTIPFDVTSAAYTNQIISVSDQMPNPWGLAVSSDGSKFFAHNRQEINEYNLENDFDLTTLNYEEHCGNPCVVTHIRSPYNLYFADEGRKMMLQRNKEEIDQYTLTVPHDFSSAVFDQIITPPRKYTSFAFSADGMKLFLMDGASDIELYQYDLAIPYDLTTLQEESVIYKKVSVDYFPTDISFSPDGHKIFVLGFTPEIILQFDLASAFDISTLDQFSGSSLPLYFQDFNMVGATFSMDGMRVFALSRSGSIYQYNLVSPYDFHNATYDGEEIFVGNQIISPLDIDVGKEGLQIVVLGSDDELTFSVDDAIYGFDFQANDHPIFTSLPAAAFLEGEDRVALDVDANDGDCGPSDTGISYSLLGEDAAVFSINQQGELRFNNIPFYDDPQDSNRDNEYDLLVQAHDGVNTTIQSVRIVVTKPRDVNLGLAVQMGNSINGVNALDHGAVVDLNEAGTIMAIGSAGNDTNGDLSGHVRVFKLDNDSWIPMGTPLIGEGENNFFGDALSLSSSGNILAVGARGNTIHGNNSGHVRVFEYRGQDWVQLGSDIDGSANSDYFGTSVSLSANGQILAVGAAGSKVVTVYLYDGISWNVMGSPFLNAGGRSVSLSDDGMTIAIGIPLLDINGTNSGGVRIYKFNGSIWGQIGSDILGEEANNYTGAPAVLNADGTVVAIGSDQTGIYKQYEYVKVFELREGEWSQRGQTLRADARDDFFGDALDLSADGSILAVGSPRDSDLATYVGQVQVFVFDGAYWNTSGPPIYGLATYDQFGEYVSLSADGTTLSVGSGNNDAGCSYAWQCQYGQVRVFNIKNKPPLFELNQSLLFEENDLSISIDLNATDGDWGANDENLSYILKGVDSEIFNITNDGIVTFKSTPNFENPMDSDADNTYDLIVEITDQFGLQISSAFSITIENNNDAPEVIDYEFYLDELNNANVVVGKIEAEDEDGDALSFEIIDHSHGELQPNLFEIDSESGVISVESKYGLDFELVPTHALTIKVSDHSLASYSSVTVHLNDLDESLILSAIGDADKVIIHPVPSKNYINIEFPRVAERYIKLIDELGREIYSIQNSDKQFRIDISKIKSTFLILQIHEAGQIEVFKIVR